MSTHMFLHLKWNSTNVTFIFGSLGNHCYFSKVHHLIVTYLCFYFELHLHQFIMLIMFDNIIRMSLFTGTCTFALTIIHRYMYLCVNHYSQVHVICHITWHVTGRCWMSCQMTCHRSRHMSCHMTIYMPCHIIDNITSLVKSYHVSHYMFHQVIGHKR